MPTRRFFDYPYFEDMAVEHRLPKTLTVRWGPYEDFTWYAIAADDAEQAALVRQFLRSVARSIRRCDDVPPLIRSAKGPLDGTHRAFAAQSLGLRLAPIAVI